MNTKPGIIIYHQEDKLLVEEIASLQTFYQLDRVIHEHDLKQQLPDGTLAILKMDDGQVVFHEQDASVRIVHIDKAFEEMTKHVFETIRHNNTEANPYTTTLAQFIEMQIGEIFTLDDVFMHLGIDKTNDGVDFAIPSIIKTLYELGCMKENMLVFTPPQPTEEPQQKKQRFVEPFEIAT